MDFVCTCTLIKTKQEYMLSAGILALVRMAKNDEIQLVQSIDISVLLELILVVFLLYHLINASVSQLGTCWSRTPQLFRLEGSGQPEKNKRAKEQSSRIKPHIDSILILQEGNLKSPDLKRRSVVPGLSNVIYWSVQGDISARVRSKCYSG